MKSPSPPKQPGHHLRVWNPELQCPLCHVWFGIQSMFRRGEGRKAPLPPGHCEEKITPTARRHSRDRRACRRNSAGPALLANQKRKRKAPWARLSESEMGHFESGLTSTCCPRLRSWGDRGRYPQGRPQLGLEAGGAEVVGAGKGTTPGLVGQTERPLLACRPGCRQGG